MKSALESPEIWSDHIRLASIGKQVKLLEFVVDGVNVIGKDLVDACEIASFEPLCAELSSELVRIENAIIAFECQNHDKNDDKTAFLVIKTGSGGHEAHAWAGMLLRMYLKYARNSNLEAELIDLVPYEPDGIRSALLKIVGHSAFGLFKNETGIHRLSRVSPYDQADRRQTSFSSVEVFPEVEKKAEIAFLDKDIKVMTCCGGGAGGQAINKTECVVIIKHLPTGIMVRCQATRSQAENKKIAFEILASKLEKHRDDQERQASQSKERIPARFGYQARTYILTQGALVHDHRTGKKTTEIERVLEGELDLIA